MSAKMRKTNISVNWVAPYRFFYQQQACVVVTWKVLSILSNLASAGGSCLPAGQCRACVCCASRTICSLLFTIVIMWWVKYATRERSAKWAFYLRQKNTISLWFTLRVVVYYTTLLFVVVQNEPTKCHLP